MQPDSGSIYPTRSSPSPGAPSAGTDFQIIGSIMQAVTLRMRSGQAFYSEVGSLSWMSDGVQMDTNLGTGGLFGALSRVVTGESLFVVNYTATLDGAVATFSSDFPGKIIPVNLAQGQAMIAQKDTLLVAEKSVNLTIAFQKRLGAGLFGGEGFILQKFEGPGTFFAAFDGEIVEYTLQPGQRMLVDTGSSGHVRTHCQLRHPAWSRASRTCSSAAKGLFLVTPDRAGAHLAADDAHVQAGRGHPPVHAQRRRQVRRPGHQSEAGLMHQKPRLRRGFWFL